MTTSASSIKAAISNAISKGAPVYNAGRPDLCYDIYRSTAAAILESGISSEAVSTVLKEALQAAQGQGSPDAQAWTMRKAFDKVLGLFADGSAELQATLLTAIPKGAKDWPVFEVLPGAGLTGPAGAPDWFGMDDVIMGGISSSTLSLDTRDHALVFSGHVTTESNGGFASVRSRPWGGWGLLGPSQGMRLLVQGDGRVYKISAKTDDTYDGVQYQVDFKTDDLSSVKTSPSQEPLPAGPVLQVPGGSRGSKTEDGWQVVDLPFEAFKPNFRGRPVRGQPPLSGSQIRQVGLMISKFGADGLATPGFRNGNFRLALRSIRGFV